MSPALRALVLHLGAEASLSDPFVRTAGVRLGAEVPLAIHDRLSLSMFLSGYPVSARGNWTPLTQQLVEEHSLQPWTASERQRGAVALQFRPLRQVEGDRERSLDVHTGLGAIRTVDDAAALSAAEDDPRFFWSADEWYPTALIGISGEVWWGRYGARLCYERSPYTEVIFTWNSLQQKPTWGSVELLWRPLTR